MNDTPKPTENELVVPPPPPPPTTTNRRPRVREVSSRFLSSSSTNSVAEDKAAVRVTNNTNKQFGGGGGVSTPVIRRGLSADYSPLGSHNYCTARAGPPPATQKRAVVKLFKENNNGGPPAATKECDDVDGGAGQLSKKDGNGKLWSSLRPDTPISSICIGGGGGKSRPDTPMASATNRIVPSRFRQFSSSTSSSSQNFHQNQTNQFNVQASSAAAKLLQSSGLSKSSSVESHCLGSDDDGSKSFPNSPNSQNSSRAWCLNLDTRSSMPDSRLLLAETSLSNSVASDSQLDVKYSSCSRSLNLPLSNSVKMMGESLSLPPPHPAYTKQAAGADVVKKGKKIFNHQEQVHCVRLLQNNYLQWRFANAKAEASLRAQTSDTERKLHSLGAQISDLRDAVKRKRAELGLLQRIKTLSTIVETHMPYLDEWSAFEEEYSTSLSETSQALSNSLVRLPVGENVQADIKEVGESLNSAMRVMEMIGAHVQSFMPKANEMDTLISELAKLVGGERVLIEECGCLLFKAYISQVEECSLRGHLMQFQNTKHLEVQE